jgi:starch-binding outer membrane protein, SusD/RagB family
MNNDINAPGRRRIIPTALLAAAVAVLPGCDLGVFDPGTIEDVDIDEPSSIQPLIVGAERNFGRATTGERPGGLYGAGAFLSDELVHSGQFVGIRDWNDAALIPDDVAETQARWANGQNARFTAEEAERRIRGIIAAEGENPDASAPVAQASLWAGFSNRVMGDAFCDAVIDGGPRLPHTAFYERALDYFNTAHAVATAVGNDSLATAAQAGIAQTQMMLGNWQAAVAAAGQVPTGYVHEMRHSDNASIEYNGLHELFLRDTQASVWGTPFAAWGVDLSGVNDGAGDPRVVFSSRDDDGEVVIGGDQRRENWFPEKYPERSTNVPIAKGTEMRLIEAEAALVGGNVGGAMTLVNLVRGFRGLDDVEANSEAEAWFLLQRERGIELWLEGRRLPDVRRWQQTPGFAGFEVVRREASGQPIEQDERRNILENPEMPGGELCLPISRNEINSNPNL